ncbi:hypothetical protein MXB_436 [Myxobolus squamalis]|nr:hypothetical protein MXB_436 [Myxobolus squamalis]
MRDSLNTKTHGIKKAEIKSGESDKNKSTATTQHHSSTDDSSTEESSSEDIAPIVVKKLSSKLTAFKPEKYNSSSSSSSEEPMDKNKFPSTTAVKKELSDSSSDSDSSASSNCQIPDLVQNHKKTGVRISKKASKSSQKVVNESKQKAFNTKVAKSKTITAKSAVSLRENLRSKTEERSELALNQDQIKAASSIIENSTASPLGDNNIVSTRLKSFHESTQKTTDGNILTSAPKNISQKSKKKVCDKIESAIVDVSPICKKSVKKTKSVQNQSSLPVKENLIETKSSVQPLNITQEETLLSKNMKRKKSVKSDHASEKKSNAESKVFEDSPLIMNKSSSTTFKRVSLPMGEIPEELRDNNFKPKNRNESGVHAQLAFQRVQGKDFKREKNKRKKGSFALGAINTTSRSFKFSEEEN